MIAQKRAMLISDLEGPWVTADHAYDVVCKCISHGSDIFSNTSSYAAMKLDGSELFKQLSAYDDKKYWIDKKRGYEPGDTLSLIAPFIIAFGGNEQFLRKVGNENANYIEGSIATLELLESLGHYPSIVSTSYEQYVHLVLAPTGIPQSRIRCTCFPLDRYLEEVKEADKELVREWATKLLELPRIEVDADYSADMLSEDTVYAAKEMDKLFWSVLPKTSFARVMKEVKPVGGSRKTEALEQLLHDHGKDYSDCVVVGDSITDADMQKRVKDSNGLSVGFNPNGYGTENVHVVIISDNCLTTAVIVDAYEKHGLNGVRNIADEWGYDTLKRAEIEPGIMDEFNRAYHGSDGFSKAVWITPENKESTIKEARVWRKKVRGSKIGSLG